MNNLFCLMLYVSFQVVGSWESYRYSYYIYRYSRYRYYYHNYVDYFTYVDDPYEYTDSSYSSGLKTYRSLSTGAIVGSIIGGIAGICTLTGLILWCCYCYENSTRTGASGRFVMQANTAIVHTENSSPTVLDADGQPANKDTHPKTDTTNTSSPYTSDSLPVNYTENMSDDLPNGYNPDSLSNGTNPNNHSKE